MREIFGIPIPTGKKALGLAIFTIVVVAVVSGTGALAPVTRLVGRAVGGLKAAGMKALGMDRRQNVSA